MNRRVQSLEGDLETCEDKLLLATQKLDKAATAADDSDRMRKVLEARAVQDEERMGKLEEELKGARNQAEDADKKYDEVQKRLQQVESELERAEERAETGEMKIIELEEELRVVANNLKSLEVSEEKSNQRESSYKEQIKSLTAKLKQAEARAEFAEKSVQKLQTEVKTSAFLLSISNRIKITIRLTDWRMNLQLNRRSTRPSLRSWRPPLLKCLVTNPNGF